MSFVGGGTDLPSYYMRESGAVISTSIDKYVYITVNRRFDQTLRVSYSQTEIVDCVGSIRHPLFREAMRTTGVDSGIEVTSIADVPSGTGLGSSSSFAVGLLHALHAFDGRFQTAESLAQQACHLEIEVLKEPIGKQDQYAGAFGGLRRYVFNPDGTVSIDPIICTVERRQHFFEHLLLMFVGGSRDASAVLNGQSNHTDQNLCHLRKLRSLVDNFWNVLTQPKDLRELGELLHEGWECKKRLATNVSSSHIDDCYERARRSGALGGKILGAGAGGFLLLFCEPCKKNAVRSSLPDLREIAFRYEAEGSKIIYVGS